MLDLQSIAETHHDWVDRMGWHEDKRPLEYIALIGSEVGECANECRGKAPTKQLGEELADVILRCLDTAVEFGFDIEAEIAAKMEKNELNGTRGRIK